MNEKPLVSIIIPTYKRAKYLGRAINSVISQSYKSIEIIVVDDNDSDSEYRKMTENIMNEYLSDDNIFYIKHFRNMNGSAARNTGIKKARGKYITFLDDDDTFLEKRIEILVNKMEADSLEKYGAVYSNIEIKNNKSSELLTDISICRSGNFKKELLLKEFTIGSGSNMLLRRNVIESLNGFDVNFKRHQDWEFLIRFFRNYDIMYEDSILGIKYMDSRINYPDSYVLEDVKSIFLTKFHKDIMNLSEDIRSKIIFIHEEELTYSYLNDRRIREAINLILKHKQSLNMGQYRYMGKIYIKALLKKILRYKKR